MIVFQVIEPAMKNKWLSVTRFGWVTELPDLRTKTNLNCGDDPNCNLTIKYAINNL